jgi:hypothetical protein
LLLLGEIKFVLTDLLVPLAVVVLFWLGLRFFRRLSGHFEDFL